jgi:hypothetical protein
MRSLLLGRTEPWEGHNETAQHRRRRGPLRGGRWGRGGSYRASCRGGQGGEEVGPGGPLLTHAARVRPEHLLLEPLEHHLHARSPTRHTQKTERSPASSMPSRRWRAWTVTHFQYTILTHLELFQRELPIGHATVAVVLREYLVHLYTRHGSRRGP